MKTQRKAPAFGIVGTPTETAVAPGGQRQAVDPATHGFVPREQLRTDRAGADPVLDAAVEAALRGDWRTVTATLEPERPDPDRYFRLVADLADLAVEDESWLYAWLDDAPEDANAWCVHAHALVRLAWRLRTAAPAPDVLPEQWKGFLRVLNQAPEAAERAAKLDPGLAAPWISLMSCAQGLDWDHDRFRGIWAEVVSRGPHSVAVHQRALQYWLPRWHGSDELTAGFVADTVDRAAPGSLLTGIRLEYLFMERVPTSDPQRSAFLRGTELGQALDAALADLAAAPAGHPYQARHRHWLAYFLTKAGRYPEAIEQFRAVDGFAGAWPWELFTDAAGTFAATRAEAILGSG